MLQDLGRGQAEQGGLFVKADWGGQAAGGPKLSAGTGVTGIAASHLE